MPNLYIANTTKLEWVFTYRLPEMQQHFQRRIRAGGQILLDHLDQQEIDEVIKQNARYGMQPAQELSRRKGFSGICWRVGEPIDVDRMLATFEINANALTEAADVKRKQTAVAASDNIAETLHRMTGINKESLRPQRLEMEVKEETEGQPTVAAGVEVISNPSANAPRRARA
jgi:hypothetical protein